MAMAAGFVQSPALARAASCSSTSTFASASLIAPVLGSAPAVGPVSEAAVATVAVPRNARRVVSPNCSFDITVPPSSAMRHLTLCYWFDTGAVAAIRLAGEVGPKAIQAFSAAKQRREYRQVDQHNIACARPAWRHPEK